MKMSTAKVLSISLAAGAAAVAVGSAAMNSSVKRTAKKLARKAVNSFSGIMDSVQGMM